MLLKTQVKFPFVITSKHKQEQKYLVFQDDLLPQMVLSIKNCTSSKKKSCTAQSSFSTTLSRNQKILMMLNLHSHTQHNVKATFAHKCACRKRHVHTLVESSVERSTSLLFLLLYNFFQIKIIHKRCRL